MELLFVCPDRPKLTRRRWGGTESHGGLCVDPGRLAICHPVPCINDYTPQASVCQGVPGKNRRKFQSAMTPSARRDRDGDSSRTESRHTRTALACRRRGALAPLLAPAGLRTSRAINRLDRRLRRRPRLTKCAFCIIRARFALGLCLLPVRPAEYKMGILYN